MSIRLKSTEKTPTCVSMRAFLQPISARIYFGKTASHRKSARFVQSRGAPPQAYWMSVKAAQQRGCAKHAFCGVCFLMSGGLRDFFFAGGTDCRASVSAGSQWQGRSDEGIAPTKSQGIRVYGGGQSRPPLRCKARSCAQRDGGDVVPQGHLFRCAPRQDAVPCEQKDSAPAGRCPCI